MSSSTGLILYSFGSPLNTTLCLKYNTKRTQDINIFQNALEENQQLYKKFLTIKPKLGVIRA